MSTIARTNSLRSPCFLWHMRGSLQPLRARLCATDASGRLTIGAALRHAVVPERDLLGALFWRAIRLARIAVLTGTVYGAGKSAGHIEILEDPKGIAKAIVRQVIIQSHVPDEENPEPAGYLTKEMPERQRVEAVGKRVLFAAREEVEAELAKLGPAPEEPVDPHEHRRAELEAAKARLAGKWYWVVTNSSNVNGYVTALCPRRVFITQGLFKKLEPTDDELAFLIGHELGHVVHGHSYRHSELQYYSALTQLLVLGVLDPTGIMAFALSGIPSLMLTAYEKKHSREDEACADATGLAICARGCFALEGSVSFMAKLHGGFHGGQHASWLDTHPSGDDRIDALRSRSEALTGRSVRSAFQRREHIYDKHCVKKKALFKAARESKRALEDA